MTPTNQEIQFQKNCELYAYVLRALHREVPDEIEECASCYDYPVECTKELSELLEGLDAKTLDIIMGNTDSQEARDLTRWWQMQQEANRLLIELRQTCL
jgi:hypothetical protein